MNIMWILLVVVLAFILCICITLLYRLKKDISNMNNDLKVIYTINQKDGASTNRLLTTDTLERNVCKLCNTINQVLDDKKTISIDSERTIREFRQAITNISHDLRTPLTSAIGFMQMLRSDKTPSDKKMEYVDIVEQRLKYLTELMNHLFEYAQIVEGKNQYEEQDINICNELRNIASTFYDHFTQRHFTVHIDIPDAPIYVTGDTGSFKRIVQNLLQNVLVHGIDEVQLSIDRGRQEIVVQNKIAHPENLDVDSLFHRFYTADFSRTSGTTGLGLAIANELVQGMNGSIRAFVEENDLNICVRFEMNEHRKNQ